MFPFESVRPKMIMFSAPQSRASLTCLKCVCADVYTQKLLISRMIENKLSRFMIQSGAMSCAIIGIIAL